jgi:hypothetical protein
MDEREGFSRKAEEKADRAGKYADEAKRVAVRAMEVVKKLTLRRKRLRDEAAKTPGSLAALSDIL